MSGGGVGGHPLPQPGAGPPRRRRCRSRGAAPAAAWKVSRRFWGALPPHRRRRPPSPRGRGDGAGGAGAPRNAAAGSPPARPVPPFPPVGDPFRPGRRRVHLPHNFLGGSGGWFWGCGEALGVSPPRPLNYRQVGPRAGPRSRERGAGERGALAAPWLPGTCRGRRLPEPCRARAGVPHPPHGPRTR